MPAARLPILVAMFAVFATEPALAQSDQSAQSNQPAQGIRLCGRNKTPVPADMAIIACTKLIEAGRAAPKTLANHYAIRADALRFLGDMPAAITDYDSALSLVPTHYEALFGRGLALIASRNLAGALADYDRLIELYPRVEFPYHNRGNIYIEQKRYDLALADFNRMIAVNPASYEGYNARAWLHLIGKRYDDALADTEAALRARPDYDAALDTRGLVNLLIGNYENAIADFDATLRISPRSAATLYSRGVAKNRRAKNRTSGAPDIAAAKRIDPDVAGQYDIFGIGGY